MEPTTATALCNDQSNTFNFVSNPSDFQGYIKTCVALTSVYLYGSDFNTANGNYYETFMNLTGWTELEFATNVQDPTSIFTFFFTNEISGPIYSHYSSIPNICDGSLFAECSFSNLTYA